MAAKADEQDETFIPDDPPTNDDPSGVLEEVHAAVPHGSSTESDDKAAEKQPEQQQAQQAPEEKKPSKLKQLWDKTGLDAMTLSMMVKGSIPPTIAIAIYQSPSFAAQYGTLGYLVAISSILGFCIMPRGKFFQTMTLNVIAICLSAAINLLALYCSTQARAHTTPPLPPGVPPPPYSYNSSASAVCAIWLIFQIYVINYLRAARPQLQFPAIVASIFVVVSMSYGVLFPNMAAAISFMKRLLEAFLTGFGLATGVSFVIFPTSSRKVVFKEMSGYLQLMDGVLKTQTAYMASLENFDPVKVKQEAKDEAAKSKKKGKKDYQTTPLMATPVSAKLQELVAKLIELQTKLHGDVTPAKREIAIGKLESHDLTELWKLMRYVFLPVMGVSSMIHILERGAELGGWDKDESEITKEEAERRHHQLDSLHVLMKNLHGPFASMTSTLGGGFQHVLLTLELIKPDKKQKTPDEESRGDEPPKPGTPAFAEDFKKKIDQFYASKQKTLTDWCKQHGIDLPPDFFDSSFINPEALTLEDEHNRERHQRQLFFTLYMEYLLWRVGQGLLDLILYVDKRKQEGAFERSKVIFPGSKTIYKWIKSTLGEEDLSQEDSFTTDMDAGGAESVYLGQSFQQRKDPEHLPPTNGFERVGDAIRKIPKFFRSEASAFGLRVVAATMTIGIVCYLEVSQLFFIKQRLLWAMVMVSISMNRTAGQSFFNFCMRIIGTTIAMIGAYIIWYIVDGHTGGVIVFLWLWMTCAFYVILKFPKYIIVAILSIVTSVLIIGYELQVRVIGVKEATSNGQPAYPTYILAPYRLATVAGGISIAFFWTIFPFPISESSELRKDLSTSMYIMTAYYQNVHQTVQGRVTGKSGSTKTKGTHAYHLNKARMTIFSKLILILNNLNTNIAFSKFQVQMGGKFPRQEYEGLIKTMQRMMLWISLASYASMTFEEETESSKSDAERSLWSSEFRRVILNVNTTSNKVTSLLSMLSSSLTSGQPMPPYLAMPEPFQFMRHINDINHDLLSIRHVVEPEYSAFAVMQVVSQCINTDIKKLTEHVKNLVGEIDFSFQAIKSSSASTASTIATSLESEDDKSKVE